ncbi:lipopolysaccharide biosynthesis protein [Luteimonas sp. TWI662]|uniref:lipopolysaccharide biosynthesis protein n=1 Tax=Luteimonas sp. TWI662 TaxID=3136789 RepID=UPI0032081ADE
MGVLSNTRWVGLSQGTKIGAQVVGMVVLARLLSPKEYGIMAMAAVVTNLAIVFRDMGSSAAIIQKQELSQEVKTAVFWFNIAVGLLISLIVLATAPLMAGLFSTQELTPVLMLLALAFPLSSSSAVHQALLERNSSFKTVARIEISSIATGLVIALGMAATGFGVYSLVAQTLITVGLTSLQLWHASHWRPASLRKCSWSELRSILGFSSHLVGFNVVNYLARNSDNIVVGRYFGQDVLGAYALAYRVMLFPLQSLTFVVSRSLYPVLSRQQNQRPEMRRTYLTVVTVVATLVAPMMGGMLVLRESFIQVFLGDGWELSSQLLFWLAPTGFIQSLLSTTGVVFMATGATRTLLVLGIVGAILQIGAFVLGANYGVLPMAKLYLVANVLNAIPVMALCMRQLEGSWLDLLKPTLIPIASAISMIVALVALDDLLSRSGDYGKVSIGALVGALVYGTTYLMIGRRQAAALTSLARNRKRTPNKAED